MTPTDAGIMTRDAYLKLDAGYRRTGVYKALAEATKTELHQLSIVLTDLRNNNEALMQAALSHGEDRTVVIQIAALWRFSTSLDRAYTAYQRSSRTLQRLRQGGLTVLDVDPRS